MTVAKRGRGKLSVVLIFLGATLECAEIRYGTCGMPGGEELVRFLKEMGANAVMISPVHGREILVEKNKEFIKLAHQNGIYVTTYQGSSYFIHWNRDRTGLKYPYCFSGQYRADYGEVLKRIASAGFDAVSVAPEEFVWERLHALYDFGAYVPKMRQGLLKQLGFDKYPYSEAFAHELRRKYKTDVVQDEREPNFVYMMKARYESVASAIKYWNECVKQVNPNCETTLLFANYLCSDRRYNIGCAWDIIGYETAVDRLGTDPYIILHNYRGDTDHWYATETTVHLVGANRNRKADVILQGTRLRNYNRPLRPVEMYGCALSCVAHGAKQIYFFRHGILMGTKPYDKIPADLNRSQLFLKRTFALLRDIDGWIQNSHIPRKIAVLCSRASEDIYQLLLNRGDSELLHQSRSHGYRYSFLAHWAVLNALFKEGYPFELYYLDRVSFDEIKDFELLIVPFPLVVTKEKARVLKQAVKDGINMLVISEYGSLDEFGRKWRKPLLLKLLGIRSVSRKEIYRAFRMKDDSPILRGENFGGAPFSVYANVKLRSKAKWLACTQDGKGLGIVLNCAYKGKVIFLAGEFGIKSPVAPVLFCYAGDFDRLTDCSVTDSPWERIAIFKKDNASIESTLSLSPLAREYRMYIVFRGSKDCKETDRLEVALNDRVIKELPLKSGWKVLEFPFKPGDARSHRLKITLRGVAGAQIHKMFFTPVLSRGEKSRPIPVPQKRYLSVLLGCVDYLLGREKPLVFRRQGIEDVEVALREKRNGVRLIFLINWEDFPVRVSVRLSLPEGLYTVEQRGLDRLSRFTSKGKKVFSPEELGELSFDLQPQAILLLRLKPE